VKLTLKEYLEAAVMLTITGLLHIVEKFKQIFQDKP
jgi:hypothetical protein